MVAPEIGGVIMSITEILNLYGPWTWPNYILIPVFLFGWYIIWSIQCRKYSKAWEGYSERCERRELLEKANEIKERNN